MPTSAIATVAGSTTVARALWRGWRFVEIAHAILGLLALFLASALYNPIFLAGRNGIRWLAVGGVLFSIVILIASQNRERAASPGRRRLRYAVAGLWIAVLLIVGGEDGRFLWQRHAIRVRLIAAHDDAARQTATRLGAHFVITYNTAPETLALIDSGFVGGLFIGANALHGRNVYALRDELATLQSHRVQAGLPPLIITTDQEGGIVSRLSPPLTRLPPLAEVIAQARLEDIERLAFDYGELQGKELAALGINVNLAPLADLAAPGSRRRFDFRSLIGQRTIAADPQRVSRAVIGYTRGLEAQGVQATLKHFPGLGQVRGDTHIIPAALAASDNALERRDWIPFRAGLQATHALLMIGHATLPALDAERPASRSAAVIQGVVRKRWQHDGLLITDDLSMGAALHDGTCTAGIEALNAGIDLLLISYDTAQYVEIFSCLLHAAADGSLDRQLLEASDQRLARLHQRL